MDRERASWGINWDGRAGVREFVVKRVFGDSLVQFGYPVADATTFAVSAMVTAGVAFFLLAFVRMLARSSSSSSYSSSMPAGNDGRSLLSMPGPPSPPWYSIFGNMLELYACPNKPYPEVFIEWVRKYGGVFTYRYGRFPSVVITDPDLVVKVGLRSFSTFHDRRENYIINFDSRGFFAGSGRYWTSVRGAAQPLFHSAQLKTFVGIMQRTSSVLTRKLKSVSPGQKVEISDWFHAFSIDTIAEAALGIQFGVQEHSTGQEKALMDALIADLNSYDLRAGFDLIDILSLQVDDLKLLRKLIALSARIPGTKRYRLQKNLTFINRECQNIVQGRQTLLGNFLTLMTKAQIDDPTNKGKRRALTSLELSALVRDILVAGTDTTGTSLTNAVYLLDKHPQVKDKLRAEIDDWYRRQELPGRDKSNQDAETELFPDADDLVELPYLGQVVNEVLRIFPPVAATIREALENCQIEDWVIPKGTTVEIPIHAMHHCPKNFPNPEEFRPERFDPSSQEHKSRHPYAFIPFGIGPRICMGRNFAMLELKIVLFKLYRHFDFQVVKEDLILNENGDLQWDANITVSMKGGLHVTVHPRNEAGM